MADQGDQESVQMDSMDQAAMEQAQSTEALGEAMNGIPVIGNAGMGDGMVQRANAEMAEVQRRADMKTQLAEASSAGLQMRVDPDQVDKLAAFFKGKAVELRERELDVQELANLAPPGSDPASKAATLAYTQVGSGDDQAYLDNYMKLANLFDATAEELKSSAQQTRSDDQGAQEALEKGQRA